MFEQTHECEACGKTWTGGCLTQMVEGMEVCDACHKILNEEEKPIETTGNRVAMTTVVLGRKGQVWDLGKGQYPGDKDWIENAFTCTQEEADRLRKKSGQKK